MRGCLRSTAARPGVVQVEWRGGSLWRAGAGAGFRRLVSSDQGRHDDREVTPGTGYTYCVSKTPELRPSNPPDCTAVAWQRAP